MGTKSKHNIARLNNMAAARLYFTYGADATDFTNADCANDEKECDEISRKL